MRQNLCSPAHNDRLVHQVPLGARYNEVVPENQRFTPQMLVTKLESEGKEVGLELAECFTTVQVAI